MDIGELTTWYGFHLLNKDDIEITRYLAMNGYSIYASGENVIFVYSEEFYYVKTILDDNRIKYKIL